MDLTKAYTAFVRAIEVGSFSAVAKDMDMTGSAVSKTIAGLESSLGIQLFTRTTRKLHPTDEALQLYEDVRQLLDTVDSIRSSGRAAQAIGPTGVLRVSMPHSFGRRRVMPLIPRFLAKYPQLKLDLVMSEEPLDLIEQGLELGIRVGTLPPSTLISRSIGILEHTLVASGAYLKQHGVPENPEDLAEHQCIVYSGVSKWSFESDHGRQNVEVTGALRINDADAIHDAVLSNLGIAQVPDWLVQRDLAKGRIQHILPEFYPIPQPISITYPQTRFLSSRARKFIDFLVEELKKA
jgi:DNA-binding transcriptional LysR family regulator